MWFRRFVIAWTLPAVLGWLVVASSFDPEPDCDRSDAVVCFERDEADLAAGVIVAVPWFAGLFVARSRRRACLVAPEAVGHAVY
jgi:hypothetical protein